MLLRPEQVWTAGEPAHPGWVVLVEGDRIAAVGPRAQVHAPAGAEVIDLPGRTLTPGLMDLHSHVFLRPYDEEFLGRPGADATRWPTGRCAPARRPRRP